MAGIEPTVAGSAPNAAINEKVSNTPAPAPKSAEEAAALAATLPGPEAEKMTRAALAEFQSSTPPVKYMGYTGDRLIWAVTAFATVGFSLFGYDQGLMSGIIAAAEFNNEFPGTKQSSSSDVYHGTIQGTVTSVYEVGAFFGAMFALFYGERLGRRKMMFMGGAIMIIGTIICSSAFGPSLAQFIVGRVVTGVGNGMNTATIPSWNAECSKAHNRGFMVCIEGSTVAVGTVIAYWIDFGLTYVDGSVSWRFPIAFQIVFAIVLMVGVVFLPESPRWLLSHGHDAEGRKVVAALAGVSIDHPATEMQVQIIMNSIRASDQNKTSFRDLLKGGKQQNLRRTLVGASSQVFQQLGGCNAVIYYSTVLFENQINLSTSLSLILGGVLSCVYALFALTSFLLVDKLGRRTLFLWGTGGQAVGMLITFACLVAGGTNNAKGAAFGLYFFIAWFGATWLPLPWLYPAELNSQAVRTQANAVSTMCNWLMNFLVVQVLPTMTASIGSYTFLLFFLANLVFFPIIYVFYPETNARELAEIDVIFAHAHLAQRRPTLVADEMPALTEHQIEVLHDRYDIHGDGEVESGAGNVSPGNVDLSLPPAAPEHQRAASTLDDSANSTRVPSVAEGNLEKTKTV